MDKIIFFYDRWAEARESERLIYIVWVREDPQGDPGTSIPAGNEYSDREQVSGGGGEKSCDGVQEGAVSWRREHRGGKENPLERFEIISRGKTNLILEGTLHEGPRKSL